jgi:hypothetical protein
VRTSVIYYQSACVTPEQTCGREPDKLLSPKYSSAMDGLRILTMIVGVQDFACAVFVAPEESIEKMLELVEQQLVYVEMPHESSAA